jgi:hypothetical protein
MVYADYQTTSSVSTMLNQLQWTTLQERRAQAKASLPLRGYGHGCHTYVVDDASLVCVVSYLALIGMKLHEPVSFSLL